MGKLTEILEFDRIIRKWRSTLPKFLKLDHARIADEHGHAPQQEIHRHACHLHLRSFFHSPILVATSLLADHHADY